MNRFSMTRRDFAGMLLLSLSGLPGCGGGMRSQEKSLLRIGIGRTGSEIDAVSTQKILEKGVSGRDLSGKILTSPHVLVYEDSRLQLTLPEAAAQISMPTAMSFRAGRLAICSASVFGRYVNVEEAVTKAKSLIEVLQKQGFAFPSGAFAKFAAVDTMPREGVNVPGSVSSIDEVIPYFLNKDYCLVEIIAFSMIKENLEVELRIKNMRRAFPDDLPTAEAVHSSEDRVSDIERRTEAVYFLEITFSEYENHRFPEDKKPLAAGGHPGKL